MRRKGAPPLSATFTKLSDARKWVQVTEAAILEGRRFKTAEAQRHTLTDLIDRCLRDVMPHKRPRTSYTQTRHLYWWKAQLGHCILADITPACVAEYWDRLAQAHTPATVNRYLMPLRHVFTVAVQERRWLDDNLLRKVRKPKEPRGVVRFLSDGERERLLNAGQGSRNPYLHTVVVLALATGARTGELLTLRWPDVDLLRGMLAFHEMKNGERRAVPLTGQALALVQQHAKVRRLDTALVFPNSAFPLT